jgi:hypothetical protein
LSHRIFTGKQRTQSETDENVFHCSHAVVDGLAQTAASGQRGPHMRLTKSARAWGTPKFREVLKDEIEHLAISELPLAQALQFGNFVADERPTVMINSVEDQGDHVTVRVGLFFAGINAGACCADDPTPVESRQEYCVVQLKVDLTTGETQARVVDQ